MASAIDNLEFAKNFPQELLKHLCGDDQVSLAAHVCGSGQIRLNVTEGKIQSIEFRQWARKKPDNGST